MEADEGEVVYLADEPGTISSADTENDQYGVEDTGLETVPEEDVDNGQFEVAVDDDGIGNGGGDEGDGKSDEKKDDNMLVVDELENEDAESASDQDTSTSRDPVLDPEQAERHLLTMPSLKTLTSDLLPLRRNRRVSVYPLTLADMYHTDIQKILDSDKCEEASLQMVRPSADMKTWAGFLSLTFVTSKAAASIVEELKSFKEGLTVKLDLNSDQSLETFIKSERKTTAWPAYWTDKLLLVRGLSSKAKVDELQSMFPGADEIVVAKDTATTFPRVGKRRQEAAVNKGDDGYAYILYNDVDKAKSVVEEYSEDPPIFYARVLDVKFYREPVAQIPKALLWLRKRKTVLLHLDKLTKNLEKSKNDPEFQLEQGTDEAIALCKQLIERDDEQRSNFGLPTPSLEDFKEIQGLKPLKPQVQNHFLSVLGVLPRWKKPNKDLPSSGPAAKDSKPLAGAAKRGRGRGRFRGRGGRGAFRADTREFRAPPSRQGGWGNRPSDPGRYMNRSVGELQADALGVMSQLARIMQQPNLGMMGSAGPPMMSAASGSLGGAGPVFGGGFGRGRSGLDSQPPAKMMRMDDSGALHGGGRQFQMDRDMRIFNRNDPVRYNDRPMLPPGHRSHSPEYRPPPQRSLRGGRGGPVGFGHDVGAPRGNVGMGQAGDYDINLLMNLSKMISQNIDQSRQMY